MGYTKRYPSGWVDGTGSVTVFDAAFGDSIETALAAAAYSIDTALSTDVVWSRQEAGDTHPRVIQYGNGSLFILDGQTDPLTISTNGANLIVKSDSGSNGIQFVADASGTIHTFCQWVDVNGAPIMWVLNAGGLNLNDNLNLTQSVFGPVNVFADIYGYFGHGRPLSMTFRHAGPPGNTFDLPTSTGEIFQGSRGASIGTWGSAFGVTGITSISNPFSGVNNPGETFHVLQFKMTAGTNLVAATGYDPTSHVTALGSCTPCVPGNYVKGLISMRAAVTTRTITPYIVFVNSSGAVISGTLTGSGVSVTSAGWAVLTVGGTVPASAAGCYLQVGASSIAANEIQYATAAGIWVDTRTSSSADPNPENVWSPAFTGQNDGTNGWTSVKTGDEYTRLDMVGTANKMKYMLAGAANTLYLPRVVGAPGSTAQPRWVGIV